MLQRRYPVCVSYCVAMSKDWGSKEKDFCAVPGWRKVPFLEHTFYMCGCASKRAHQSAQVSKAFSVVSLLGLISVCALSTDKPPKRAIDEIVQKTTLKPDEDGLSICDLRECGL